MPSIGMFAAIFDEQGRILWVKRNCPPGTTSGLAVSGDYLFVPQRDEGVSTVDNSRPRLPKVIVHDQISAIKTGRCKGLL